MLCLLLMQSRLSYLINTSSTFVNGKATRVALSTVPVGNVTYIMLCIMSCMFRALIVLKCNSAIEQICDERVLENERTLLVLDGDGSAASQVRGISRESRRVRIYKRLPHSGMIPFFSF